jgi:MFS family permease
MSKKTKLALLMQFFASFSFFVVQIFIPQYAQMLRATKFQIGIIATFFSLALFISSWLFGRFADKIGRRKIILLGFFFSSLTYLLGAFAYSFSALFVFRMLAGFAAGIYPGALAAYVYESGGKMGKYTGVGAIGMALSQYTAGVIATILGIRYLFVASAVTFFVAFVIALYGIKKEEYVPMHVSLFPKDVVKRNHKIYVPLFLRHLGATGIWAYWVLYLGQLGANNYWKGMLNVFNFLTQFLVMYFVIDRINTKKSIGWGLLLSAGIFFYFAICPTYLWIIPGMIATGFAWSFLYAGSLREATEHNAERATASGLVQSSISLGNIFGPLVSSIIVSISGTYKASMYFAFAITLVAYVYYYFASKREVSGN